MVEKLTILGGQDKEGMPENIRRLDIDKGEILVVAGPTGSGKTQLMSDIEQYVNGETPTRRAVYVNDLPAGTYEQEGLVAEVSQNMNFVMDMCIKDFLIIHAMIRAMPDPENAADEVLAAANLLAGEPLSYTDNLTQLSGGQSRALMVADVALISNAPVVLIDEIENAGIDRLQALEFLSGQGKIVIVVTHDPTLMLMGGRRVIMKNGGMYKLHRTSVKEKEILQQLMRMEKDISMLRNHFRNGESMGDH